MSSFFACESKKNHLQYLIMGKIALSRIKKEFPYSFCFPANLPLLTASIKAYGIIQPVIITKSFHLVCGRRRLAACRELNIDTIPAIVLDNAAPPLSLFQLNIADNLSTRPLNIIEKSRVLAMFKDNFKVTESNIVKMFLPLLDLPSHPKYLQKFIWISNLPYTLKKTIIDRKMSIGLINNIKDWPPAVTNRILPILFEFNFGNNKTNQIIELLNEISLLTNKPVDTPANDPTWLEIYNDPKLSLFQKGNWLRLFLLTKKYPAYSALKIKIKRYINNLKLPPNISIASDELLSLEKKQITFRIQCQQQKDLEKAARVLTAASHSRALKDLLQILQV